MYRCSAFQAFSWLRHGFGTRSANPPVSVTLRQIHSNLIVNPRHLTDREGEGDALITNEVGKAVGIRTADCVPILLLDPDKRTVSAIHAGWRGTASGIGSLSVERLQDEFGSDPARLLAAIGPCIRQCCYEVGDEVADRFTDPKSKKALGSKWKLDLPADNRTKLICAGIPADHIFDIGLCTACEAHDFFSYRREPGNPGRMISSIERTA